MARIVNHFRWYNKDKIKVEEGQFYDDPSVRLLDPNTNDNSIQIRPGSREPTNQLSINGEVLPDAEEDIIVEGTIVKKDQSGEKMMYCCLRSTLSLLHVIMALLAGFISVYSLLDWDQPNNCLPALVDNRGQPIKFEHGLPFICDSLVYAMCGVCVFNLIMCLVINFTWKRPCVSFIHLMLSVMFVALSVLGGALLTVYYMAWCDTLVQYNRQRGGSGGCWEAAKNHGPINGTYITMSMYMTRMEIRQISVWALFPLSLFAVAMYAILTRIVNNADEFDEVPSGQFRYVIMHDDPSVPTSDVRNRPSSSASASNFPQTINQSTSSSNPFDED